MSTTTIACCTHCAAGIMHAPTPLHHTLHQNHTPSQTTRSPCPHPPLPPRAWPPPWLGRHHLLRHHLHHQLPLPLQRHHLCNDDKLWVRAHRRLMHVHLHNNVPAPTLVIKSSTDFFSKSLAKRPGQYGSTSTPAALTMEEMLSACGKQYMHVNQSSCTITIAAMLLQCTMAGLMYRQPTPTYADFQLAVCQDQRRIYTRKFAARRHPE